MRPREVGQAIKLLYTKRRPGFIWGPPGVGKSSVMSQTADELNIELRDIRLSQLDPTDLKGFPTANKEKRVMEWLQPDFLPNDPKSKGILFFDEANAAPKSVEAPMYQLTLDRKLGDYKLPNGWSIMMAGNRETDRAIANRMSSALGNRLIHVDYELHLDDWLDWAVEHKIDSMLLGFMNFRSELLHKFDPNSKAWPSPRTWEFANEVMNSGLPESIEFELLKGTVGEGAAGEFAAFMRVYRDLPSIERILAAPERERVPEKPDALYAISVAMAEKVTKANFDTFMKYVNRLAKEYQVVFIRDVVRRKAPIENSKAFINWSIDNAEVLA